MDWTHIARDGAILAVGACALIALVLTWKPRLFLRHFPAELAEGMPPKSRGERIQSLVAGLLLIGWIAGVMYASTAAAEARLGAAFPPLFLHAWLVGMAFNLADWLILDELWLGRFPPPFARGVRFDHAKHFRDFLKGSVGIALFAAAVTRVVRVC